MTKLLTKNRVLLCFFWGSCLVVLVSGFQSPTSTTTSFFQSNNRLVTTTESHIHHKYNNWKPRKKYLDGLKAIEFETEVRQTTSITATPVIVENNDNIDIIPTTMSDAVKTFFLSPDYTGPLMVVGSILSFTVARLATTASSPITAVDGSVLIGSIIFWSFQEHILHQRLLHSKMDWPGKEIHNEHHSKPYYHISIDSPGLLIGWMVTAHLLLRTILPFPLALSATIGYSLAGLFYEWAHYLVHTRVKFQKGSFWKLVKDNHVRHHLVNHNYWFSFSLPWIDDLFGTNPSPRSVSMIDKK